MDAGCVFTHTNQKRALAKEQGTRVTQQVRYVRHHIMLYNRKQTCICVQTQCEQWVVGLIDRVTDQIRLYALEESRQTVNRSVIDPILTTNTQPLTTLVTDSSRVYNTRFINASRRFHVSVNHSRHQWVTDEITTVTGVALGPQRIENAWNFLRKMIENHHATGASLTTEGVQQYCSEFEWRYNNKLVPATSTRQRFDALAKMIKAATQRPHI